MQTIRICRRSPRNLEAKKAWAEARFNKTLEVLHRVEATYHHPETSEMVLPYLEATLIALNRQMAKHTSDLLSYRTLSYRHCA